MRPVSLSLLLLALLVTAGCATTESSSSVFLYDRVDLEATIQKCRAQDPVTRVCRDDMIRKVRAHIDAAKLQDKDWNITDRAFSLLTLGGTTAATGRQRSAAGKDDIAVGLVLVAGVRQIFDVGGDDSDRHSSDVWRRFWPG